MPAAGFVAAASSFVGNWLVSFVWFRPRPFIDVPGVHLLVPPPLTAYSFPSSHSAAAFAIAFTVVFFHRRFGLALVAAAALVALSRVFVGVHYPLDILVGGAFGIGWAALGARIFGADVCVWRPLSTSGKTTSGTE
jgi:undecaprenyl-diphosphatase